MLDYAVHYGRSYFLIMQLQITESCMLLATARSRVRFAGNA